MNEENLGNEADKNNSKDNYEKLREFFKERIKILENKGLISKDIFKEVKNGQATSPSSQS